MWRLVHRPSPNVNLYNSLMSIVKSHKCILHMYTVLFFHQFSTVACPTCMWWQTIENYSGGHMLYITWWFLKILKRIIEVTFSPVVLLPSSCMLYDVGHFFCCRYKSSRTTFPTVNNFLPFWQCLNKCIFILMCGLVL